MAVLQMQHISICALKKDRKAILEILQRRGVAEISDILPEDSVFEKTDTSAMKTRFEKNAALAGQALEVLDIYCPVKTSMFSSLEGRKALSVEEYEKRAQKVDEIMGTADKLTALSKKIAENQAEILKLETQMDALKPWMGLDISLRFTGTRSTAAFIGSFSEEMQLDQIYRRLAELAPNTDAVSVDLISQSREQTCVLIVCLRKDADKIDEALRSMGFVKPASPSKEPPAERQKILEGRIAAANSTISAAVKEIESCKDQRDDLHFMGDYFTMRSEKYDIIGRMMQTKRTFLLSGYVPQKYVDALEQELSSKFDLAFESNTPDPEADAPVVLKNNPYSRPIEAVVESYSLPGKTEVDPTFFVSIFYYFLFGMMLSDAGYGLVLALGCGIVLLKFKNMEGGIKKMIQMFFLCGIFTMFWGIAFGSYFGDAVSVIASTFFDKSVEFHPLWFWFEPVKTPIRLLTFSFLIGIIHLFAGLALQAYQLCKQHKYKDAIYDVVFWYLLVGGGIFYLLTMRMITDMLEISAPLPPVVATISAVCMAVGAIGIILTGGRESRNPIKRLLKGLYAVYNVTGYLSDILSYSRLLALGLATGVIATVFNKMGSMGGGGILGAIMFILVFIIGHALNIGINVLGAYVHTNRLQFVEFFGKFYEGGGRPFAPFAAHTKYYKFEEDK